MDNTTDDAKDNIQLLCLSEKIDDPLCTTLSAEAFRAVHAVLKAREPTLYAVTMYTNGHDGFIIHAFDEDMKTWNVVFNDPAEMTYEASYLKPVCRTNGDIILLPTYLDGNVHIINPNKNPKLRTCKIQRTFWLNVSRHEKHTPSVLHIGKYAYVFSLYAERYKTYVIRIDLDTLHADEPQEVFGVPMDAMHMRADFTATPDGNAYCIVGAITQVKFLKYTTKTRTFTRLSVPYGGNIRHPGFEMLPDGHVLMMGTELHDDVDDRGKCFEYIPERNQWVTMEGHDVSMRHFAGSYLASGNIMSLGWNSRNGFWWNEGPTKYDSLIFNVKTLTWSRAPPVPGLYTIQPMCATSK